MVRSNPHISRRTLFRAHSGQDQYNPDMIRDCPIAHDAELRDFQSVLTRARTRLDMCSELISDFPRIKGETMPCQQELNA